MKEIGIRPISFRISLVLCSFLEKLKRLQKVKTLETDPNLRDGALVDFLSREEQFVFVLKKTIYILEKLETMGITDPNECSSLVTNFYPGRGLGFPLHLAMFIPFLRSMANTEQANYWLKKALNMEIIGCYAQTELGHGTFLRGLETTATYDPDTEQFVINSPHLTSIKWWPGGLGKISTHCIVIAQLYTKGQSYGIHPFIVQIRSMEDHTLMPGITTGDIGPKMGMNSCDNGFMKLDHVHIPRNHMLMKYYQVLKDGTYVSNAHKKMMYGSMMQIRSSIIYMSSIWLAVASTIAIRYSAVRLQTENVPGLGEEQILNYQNQQYKLFSCLSSALALNFTWQAVNISYQEVSNNIAEGKTNQLQSLHSLLAGLKAVSSWMARDYVQTCRESCGGHGYSLASGLPQIQNSVNASCTYEGDNTVMILQTARYLLKCSRELFNGTHLSGLLAYLEANYNAGHQDVNSDLHLPALLRLYQHRAERMIAKVSKKFLDKTVSGCTFEKAFNVLSNELAKVAIAHCQVYIVEKFIDAVNKIVSIKVKSVLTDMCKLYCAVGIIENLGDFLQFNLLGKGQVIELETAMYNLLSRIRPNAVALVDAFDFTDSRLQSVLGRYDGQVYNALYNYAQHSPLNKTEVHESYENHLKPFLRRRKLKAQL